MARTPTTGCLASARLAWPALHRLRTVGRDPAPALEAAGLSLAEVEDPDHRMPEELLDELWIACRDLAKDEAFGIHAGLDAPVGQLGVVEYVVRNCPTLLAAMEAGHRFQRILHDAGDDHFEIEGDRAHLVVSLSSGREPAGVLVDYAFARAVSAAMLLTGVAGRPLELSFVHGPPRTRRPWERTFRCPIHFGAERNVMAIDRARLDATILGSDLRLLGILEQHAEAKLPSPQDAGGFTRRVCALISKELVGGTPTADAVAERLHMSARTLARRLADEDTSFSTLLDDLRRELATSHLRDRDLSVSEVAFLLGFRDANAFSRAFKRWTGVPPTRFRAQASAG